jgi:hypothetical protein
MKKFSLVGVLTVLVFLGACGPDSPETLDTAESPAETNFEEIDPFYSVEQNGIRVIEAPHSPNFPNAKISLEKPELNKNLNSGLNSFIFNVENFELGAQTADAEHRECANSAQGQHIHWILNNTPYTAHYEPKVEKTLENGKHLLLAFLSRSYHESLKKDNAYILKQINVGPTQPGNDFNLNDPHLFYSRPKGEYVGDDTHSILIDFYLVNTNISENGNKVRLIIDGTSFMLTKWVPYKVEGLTAGEHTFRLQLIDKAGMPVEGPFNDSGDRIITLKPGDHDHSKH